MAIEDRTIFNWNDPKSATPPKWLGIVVDNRHLFDALQDDWLSPVSSDTGLLLGVERYFGEREVADGNRINVQVQVDFARLPNLQVNTLRDGGWVSVPLSQVASTDGAVFWPGMLPLFPCASFTVSSAEEQARLASMGKRVSNVEVPDVEVRHDRGSDSPPPATRPVDTAAGLTSPQAGDSVRGALSMAIWAVPRMAPWFDVLCESLASPTPTKELEERARAVAASWWRFPPWAPAHHASPNDTQERLWLAAMSVFSSSDRIGPREAADRIAASAMSCLAAQDTHEIESWHRATRELLEGVARVEPGIWPEQPVGLAIQLVLLRPDPLAFKTWFEGGCEVAPGVAWSAAALCGLSHGYKRLDTRFRGKEEQREIIAVNAMRMGADAAQLDWPGVSDEPATWRKENEHYKLRWGGREIACKTEQTRGKWHSADLTVDSVQRQALGLAKQMRWPCISKEVLLKKGRKPVTGSGTATADELAVIVRGDEIRMRLSPGDQIVELIDESAFRHLIAVTAGQLPPPPRAPSGDRPDAVDRCIPGLTFVPDLVTEAEEETIVSEIDSADWSNELQRRVQHYGWRYDYKSRQIDPSMHIGPLPSWARMIAERLVEAGFFREGKPDQVIVNEYRGNQGISPHVDSPSSFGGVVAMVSLLESWEMVFRKRGPKTKDSQVTVRLEQRSATILEGDARYRWTHEIRKRNSEPGATKPGNKHPSRIPRVRRISLTFRKIKEPAGTAKPLPGRTNSSRTAPQEAKPPPAFAKPAQ